MLIFDAHLDLAWNAVEWNRNLEYPCSKIREWERHFPDIVPGDCTVTLPEMHKGRIGLCIATLLPRLNRKPMELSFYQSREAAHAIALGQLAYYRAMVRKGAMVEIPDKATLKREYDRWQAAIAAKPNDTSADPPIGFIISMEGAPPIQDPSQVQQWYDWGLRLVGPAHYGPNEYCHGTGSVGGLTADGRALLKEMDRVGMLLDATHLADQSFWEALDVYTGPVIASHHNCRALVPGDRQLDDDQIKALISRGAVIGAAFDNWMIVPGYKKKVTPSSEVPMELIVNHIDHICQLAGNANHCGIGTDLDGGFGREQSPGDLDTIGDVINMKATFEKRGYSKDDIEKIFHRNFIEFFLRVWK